VADRCPKSGPDPSGLSLVGTAVTSLRMEPQSPASEETTVVTAPTAAPRLVCTLPLHLLVVLQAPGRLIHAYTLSLSHCIGGPGFPGGIFAASAPVRDVCRRGVRGRGVEARSEGSKGAPAWQGLACWSGFNLPCDHFIRRSGRGATDPANEERAGGASRGVAGSTSKGSARGVVIRSGLV